MLRFAVFSGQVLTELEYLNMGYNFLSKIPNLGLHSRAKLVTLILRYNQLDNINGKTVVEDILETEYLGIRLDWKHYVVVWGKGPGLILLPIL